MTGLTSVDYGTVPACCDYIASDEVNFCEQQDISYLFTASKRRLKIKA